MDLGNAGGRSDRLHPSFHPGLVTAPEAKPRFCARRTELFTVGTHSHPSGFNHGRDDFEDILEAGEPHETQSEAQVEQDKIPRVEPGKDRAR